MLSSYPNWTCKHLSHCSINWKLNLIEKNFRWTSLRFKFSTFSRRHSSKLLSITRRVKKMSSVSTISCAKQTLRFRLSGVAHQVRFPMSWWTKLQSSYLWTRWSRTLSLKPPIRRWRNWWVSLTSYNTTTRNFRTRWSRNLFKSSLRLKWRRTFRKNKRAILVSSKSLDQWSWVSRVSGKPEISLCTVCKDLTQMKMSFTMLRTTLIPKY